MLEGFPDEVRAYHLWQNTFETTPENYVKWRERNELYELVTRLGSDDSLSNEDIGESVMDWWNANCGD